jgi:drug/metabolite transporter (DMT)-like permease
MLAKVRRSQLQRTFGPLTLVCFAVCVLGSDFLARTMVSQQSPSEALSEQVHYMSILGLLMLGTPFLAVDLLTVEVGRAAPLRTACWFFGILTVLVGALYVLGYWSSREALLHHKWTASALAIGLLPLQSLPILVVGLVAAEVIRRRYKHAA